MATKTADTAPIPDVIAEQQALDREQRREERKALVAIPAADLSTAAQRVTFQPQSMGEAMQFAALMARSNFVPMHLRGKEGDCMAIVMQAARWGMDPFAVGNKSYFVKDGAPPAFEAQLINAVVNSSGALSGRLRIQFEGEGEKLRCTVTGFLRADPDDAKVKTQAIARVTTRNSPLWKADPEQQLAYYTTRAWARLWTPEVLLGVYTPDELDIDPERARNITPPMPRRGAMPAIGASEQHDEETGEVYRAGGGDDEAVERRLDAAAMHGEAGDADYQGFVDGLHARLRNAKILGDVIAVGNDLQRDGGSLPDEVFDMLDQAVDAAGKRFREGGK